MTKTDPAYLDNKSWSDHSRDWLRADRVPLTTAEIKAEGEVCEECARCGAHTECVKEDRCPECGAEGCMSTGVRFAYGCQDYFVSFR